MISTQICKCKDGTATLILSMHTEDGKYTSMTQYNTGSTDIALNGLTFDDITNIREGLDELEKAIDSEAVRS